MSQDHDHPHDHSHEPEGGHPHDHGHAHARPATPTSRPAEPEMPLDPGAQALSEALKSSFGIVKIVMVLLVGVFLVSGFFVVNPQERAIILRFGRPVGEGQKALLGPGLHFAFPYPVDEVVKVPFTEIQQVTSTVGWFFVTPEQELAGTEPPPMPSLNPAVDGYVLTADQNIIHSRAVLNYRIEDPITYVFNFAGASNAVLNALNNALVQAASEFKVDDILSRDVFGYKDTVRRHTVELLARQKVGVVVEQLEVSSRPPLYLKTDFARVADAAQKRDDLISAARTYQNQVISKADADASSLTNTAESDRTWYVESLKAEASRFKDLLPRYEENPQLFVQARLMETLGRVMTNVQDKIYLSEAANGKTRELRLLLNREPPKIKTEKPSP
ncbi:MAG TPA: protease modulator HflK [Verrucomicrobiae bacterium]|nr:protease modulator HflK [Verrucomicrobiae bacterium]